MCANNRKKSQFGGIVPILMIAIILFSAISFYAMKTQNAFSIISNDIAYSNETRIKMNGAAANLLSYAANIDGDDFYEPVQYALEGSLPIADAYARYETDAWERPFIYCPYDIGNDGHSVEGEKDPSSNRFKGEGVTSTASHSSLIMALISRGRNGTLESECSGIINGRVVPIKGGDDIVMVFPHARVFDQVSQTLSGGEGGVSIQTYLFETRQEFEASLNARSHGSVHQVDIERDVSGTVTPEYLYPLVFNKTGRGPISIGMFDPVTESRLTLEKSRPHFLEMFGPNAWFEFRTPNGAVTLNPNGTSLTSGIQLGRYSGGTFDYYSMLIEDGYYIRRSTAKTNTNVFSTFMSKTNGIRLGNISAGDTSEFTLNPQNDLGISINTTTTGTVNGIYHDESTGNYKVIGDNGLFYFQRKYLKQVSLANAIDTTAVNGATCENIYRGMIINDASGRSMICN